MKFTTPVSLNVLSPLALYAPAEFVKSVRNFCEHLPELMPEKWGWREPLDRQFDAHDLKRLIPSGRSHCETIDWKRTHKPKAEGTFRVRWHSKSPKVLDTHSCINFSMEFGEIDQERLINWLKSASIQTAAHISILDIFAETRRSFLMESGAVPSGDRFFVTTHVLRHWLPDVFWGTVFGPPYVALFGKECLLKAPAFMAEEIADDTIYIQLTEHISDVTTSLSYVQARQVEFKEHVGIDAFYESGRGYDRLARGPLGDVFVVPNFELSRVT
jgi:hypothetical protein